MGAIKVEIPPVCDPVDLATVKAHLRLITDDDDALITGYIKAASRYCEDFTGRSFINKGYAQYLDTFPYYVDSNPAQIGYGPSFYTWPRYATTLWNEAQRIRLYYSELQAVSRIVYLDAITDTFVTLYPSTDVSGAGGDFVVDAASKPPRLFPNPGDFWPAAAYTPNAVCVHFIAGYNNDAAIAAALEAMSPAITPATSPANCTPQEAALRQADVPFIIKLAIMQLVADWYEHPDATSDLSLKEIPNGVQRLLWAERVFDLDTTRQ
jgi:hypothetical protein